METAVAGLVSALQTGFNYETAINGLYTYLIDVRVDTYGHALVSECLARHLLASPAARKRLVSLIIANNHPLLRRSLLTSLPFPEEESDTPRGRLLKAIAKSEQAEGLVQTLVPLLDDADNLSTMVLCMNLSPLVSSPYHENARAAAKAGAIPKLVRLLRQSPASPTLTAAADALWSIVKLSGNRCDEAVKAGGVEALQPGRAESDRHSIVLAPLKPILEYEQARLSGPRKQVLSSSSALLVSLISRGGRYPIAIKEQAGVMLLKVVASVRGCTAVMQQPGYAQALLKLATASKTYPFFPLYTLNTMMHTLKTAGETSQLQQLTAAIVDAGGIQTAERMLLSTAAVPAPSHTPAQAAEDVHSIDQARPRPPEVNNTVSVAAGHLQMLAAFQPGCAQEFSSAALHLIREMMQHDLAAATAQSGAGASSSGTSSRRSSSSGSGSREGAADASVCQCAACGSGSGQGQGGALMQCSRCGSTSYCSRQCQKDHWPQHRKDCKK